MPKPIGRPKGTTKGVKSKCRPVSMTDEEYARFKELGGSKWLRGVIKLQL